MGEDAVNRGAGKGVRRSYYLDPYEFDAAAGILHRGDEETLLPPRAARVLELLLARSGQLVTKDELLENVWDGASVGDSSLASTIKILRKALGDDARDPSYIQTLHRRGYRFVGTLGEGRFLGAGAAGPEASLSSAVKSLVVVPFDVDARSGDREQGQFAYALSHRLSAELAAALSPGRRMIPFDSAKALKDQGKSGEEIARELNADAVIMATLATLGPGSRTVVTMTLHQSPDMTQRWFDDYVWRSGDLLELTGEAVLDIVQELGVELEPERRKRLANAPPVNADAERAYVIGQELVDQRTPASIQASLRYFEDAIQYDPDFALAYVGRGWARWQLGGWYIVPSVEAHSVAKVDALRALDIDQGLPEAYVLLAITIGWCEWNGPAAEDALQKAILINEDHVQAHQAYGQLLVYWGRTDAGLGELQRARALDPTSLGVNLFLGSGYWVARDYAQAIDQLEQVVGDHPQVAYAHAFLSGAYADAGRSGKAIESAEKAADLSRREQLTLGFLGYAYAKAKRPEQARDVLDELMERRAREFIAPDMPAMIAAALGETERALQYLEEAAEEGAYGLMYWKEAPLGDSLRDEPRFQRLMKLLNFPEAR